MEIKITSAQELPDIDTTKPYAIISISEPTSKLPDIPTTDNLVGFIRLVFADIDRYTEKYGPLITDKQAKQMINFGLSVVDKAEVLICQCDAGISRSAATAAALSVVLGIEGGDSKIFRDERYVPNMKVYRTILCVWVQMEHQC